MIQDIVYAIKYDKLATLNLNVKKVKELEDSILLGITDWKHHPIITCLYENKVNSINNLTEMGFNINAQFKTYSLLFCTLFEKRTNLFMPLYQLGAQFKEEEKSKALSRAHQSKVSLEIIQCLIKDKYFTKINEMLQIANAYNYPSLIDICMEIDSKSVKNQASHALKLSLESGRFSVAEKYLTHFHKEIDLDSLDTTFFQSQAKEFIESFISKLELEKNLTIDIPILNKKLKL